MIASVEELIQIARQGGLAEHRLANVELKSNWSLDHGRKLSALANRLDEVPKWMVLGVSDDGVLLDKSEAWARQIEQSVSQQINDNLNPAQACSAIRCHEIDGAWVVTVRVQNPGDVVYWGERAYRAAGTTIAELAPDEVLRLRVQLPGLADFSRQPANVIPDQILVRRFLTRVAARGRPIEGSGINPDRAEEVLRTLGLAGTQAEKILFGDCSFRLVRYDDAGQPIQNERLLGVYTLLTDDFILGVQQWARGRLRATEDAFSDQVLREALANAVAHAAYYEDGGDIIIEQNPESVTIGNLCVRESTYFANRWFSRSHKTVNGLLMETLRVAGHVDELGRGKSLIFTESIRNGKRPPQVVIERAGRYDRWKLTLYGGTRNTTLLRLLERCRAVYHDDQKALIALALVLWSDRPVSDIRNFVDGDFARQFGEVLSDLKGPIFYYREKDQITLRRWARVLLGEGRDSKALSPAEERDLREFAYDLCTKYHDGHITPKTLRDLAAMGDTPSEQVLSSSILGKWKNEGVVRLVRRGLYKFVPKKAAVAPSLEALFDLFRSEPGEGDSV